MIFVPEHTVTRKIRTNQYNRGLTCIRQISYNFIFGGGAGRIIGRMFAIVERWPW